GVREALAATHVALFRWRHRNGVGLRAAALSPGGNPSGDDTATDAWVCRPAVVAAQHLGHQAGVGWSTQIYQCVIHHCGIGQVDVIATGEHRGLTRITVTAAAPVFQRDIDPQAGLKLESIRCRSGVGAFVLKAAVTAAIVWWRVRWSGRGTTAGT